jgi:negative regulator of replication initiation
MLIRHRVGVRERTLLVNALDEEWWGELLNVETHAPADSSSVQKQPTSDYGVTLADTPHDVQEHTVKPKTARKPEAITLLGDRYPVRNWKGLLMAVCTVLAERHPEQFAAFGQTLHGRKRQYISSTQESMFSPVLIPGTTLFVESNLSSGDILQLAHSLLEGLGYPADLLVVQMRQ